MTSRGASDRQREEQDGIRDFERDGLNEDLYQKLTRAVENS